MRPALREQLGTSATQHPVRFAFLARHFLDDHAVRVFGDMYSARADNTYPMILTSGSNQFSTGMFATYIRDIGVNAVSRAGMRLAAHPYQTTLAITDIR
jgi:hypothetical protein